MIKTKPKICSSCGLSGPLWKSNPKLCKMCVNKPESGKTHVIRGIKPISDSMLQKLKVYRKERDIYMKDNPVCEYPFCELPATELHHAAGRVGDLLTDPRYFKALCNAHHSYVELNPDMAKELSLSTTRTDK